MKLLNTNGEPVEVIDTIQRNLSPKGAKIPIICGNGYLRGARYKIKRGTRKEAQRLADLYANGSPLRNAFGVVVETVEGFRISIGAKS